MSNMTGIYNADNAKEAGEASGEFVPAPKGIYTVMITESEYKNNSSNTGKLLAHTMVIADGEHKEKKIFGNLNRSMPYILPIFARPGFRNPSK